MSITNRSCKSQSIIEFCLFPKKKKLISENNKKQHDVSITGLVECTLVSSSIIVPISMTCLLNVNSKKARGLALGQSLFLEWSGKGFYFRPGP